MNLVSRIFRNVEGATGNAAVPAATTPPAAPAAPATPPDAAAAPPAAETPSVKRRQMLDAGVDAVIEKLKIAKEAEIAATPTPAAPAADPAAPAADPAGEKKPDEKPAEDPKFAEKFKNLARAEWKVKEAEKVVDAKLAKLTAFENVDKLFDTDPIAAIEAIGKDPNTVLKMIAAQIKGKKPVTPIDEVKDEVKQLKEKEAQREAAAEAAKQREADEKKAAFVTGYKESIWTAIEAEKDGKFAALATEAKDDAIAAVYKLIDLTYASTGEILEIEKAALLIEERLVQSADKIAAARKSKEAPAAPKPGAPQTASKATPANGPKSPTLSSAHGASTPTARPGAPAVAETFDEKIERLAKGPLFVPAKTA